MANVLCPVCTNWACVTGDWVSGHHRPRCPVPGAAVELLEACKAVRVAWLRDANEGDGIRDEDEPILVAVNLAIARAEGEQA